MKKVYVVDDDRNIVESITIVLKSAGYDVQAQYDQKNVVQNVEKYAPHLIILDVMFPEDEGAGFEMAREIKKNPRTQKIPIMMLSAINEKGIYAGTFSNRDRDDAWLPVNEFVEKPINPKTLLSKVQILTA
jgi:two-component system, OmpR family, alkaline phosphatase synthesis response regulator PhoP